MKAKRRDEAAERDNYGHDSGLANERWGGEAAASVRSVWEPDSATSEVRKRSSPTAVCGKPHVRWCGRVPGRNPRHPTRSPKHRGLANAPFYAAPKPFRPLTGAAFLRILSTR